MCSVVEKLLDNESIVMWTSRAYLEKVVIFEVIMFAFSAHMTDTKQVELRSKSLQDFQFAMVSNILVPKMVTWNGAIVLHFQFNE